MEWLFLLITYLPIVSIVVGLILLIAGLVVKKTDNKKAGCFVVSADMGK